MARVLQTHLPPAKATGPNTNSAWQAGLILAQLAGVPVEARKGNGLSSSEVLTADFLRALSLRFHASGVDLQV